MLQRDVHADLLERAGQAAAAWARAERAMGNVALQRELHRRSASAAEKELGSGSPGLPALTAGVTSLPA